MKVFALTLPNNTYPHLPEEDAFKYRDNIFCVADGITRDLLTNLRWSELSDEEKRKYYPNPSPATLAAKISCETFLETKAKTAKERIVEANNAVAVINKNLVCDYLTNDFAGCVMSGVIIKENKLSWASIGDCQMVVFDGSGNIVFLSPNGLELFDNYIEDSKKDWGNPARRVEIRREFRNKPGKKIDGKEVSYGAITGEKVAEEFIFSGEIDVDSSATVVLYTDGFAGYINRPEFLAKLKGKKKDFIDWSNGLAPKDYKKFGRERTLIAIFF